MDSCRNFLIPNLPQILSSLILHYSPQTNIQATHLTQLQQNISTHQISQLALLHYLQTHSQIIDIIQDRATQILLWVYSFFKTSHAQLEQRKSEFLNAMLEINKNYKKGDFKSYFLMSLLTNRKKWSWSWSIEQCRQLQKEKQQIGLDTSSEPYINLKTLIERGWTLYSRQQRTIKKVQKSLQNHKSQTKKAILFRPTVNQDNLDNKERRIEKLVLYIKKTQSEYKMSPQNLRQICEELLLYLDIFLAEAIKDVIQNVIICNDKFDSQTQGNEFRYFSEKGFQINKFYNRKIQKIPKINSLKFHRVIYPSKLQIYNNLKIDQYNTERQYMKLIQDKFIKNTKNIGQKKLYANYIFSEGDAIPPTKFRECISSRTKKRVVISGKHVQNILLKNPKYEQLFVRELSLINFL